MPSMDVVTTVLDIVLGPIVVLLLGWYGKGRFDSLDQRVDRLEQRLDGRIDALQVSVDGRISALQASVEGRIDGLRTDITQIALAVGGRPRAGNG
jgi:hypothetical protein